MADPLTVVIDLSALGADLDAEEQEAQSLALADELREGNLAESAALAREADLPTGAKSGALAFIGGVLTAEVNRENIKKTVDFLGNRFYGKVLTLKHRETTLEYRNAEELELALSAVERLDRLSIEISDQT